MKGQIAVYHPKVFFRLLGPVQAHVDQSAAPLDLGPELQRRLLVVLLIAAGRAVDRERLIATVWDGRPPRDELDAVWRLASKGRRRLHDAGLPPDVLVSSGGTYRLDIPPEQVDLHVFRALSGKAQELLGHDDGKAHELLRRAIGLRQGQPLAGLKGTWIGSFRHTIEEEFHVAEIALYEAAIRMGRSGEAVPRLAELSAERPGDEQVAWLSMNALYRCGRQEDALEIYHRVRGHLDATIAAESLQALADLHQRMLDRDPTLLDPEAVAYPLAGRSSMRSGTSTDDETGRHMRDAENDEDPSPDPRVPGIAMHGGKLKIANSAIFQGQVTVERDLNFNAR